jgi:hypothetical protein
MTDADLKAIAVYLKDEPSQNDNQAASALARALALAW